MKRIIFVTSTLTFLAMTGCQKKVTDEVVPNDRLSSELAFSSPQKIENAVLGAYNALQSANYLSGRALIYVDLMGEDIFDKGAFFGDLARFNMLSNNGLPATVWTAGYAAIATANRVEAGITANSSLLSAQKAKELLAECKFIRGISHFYLVNFFAQPYVFTADASHIGIPVITENFTANTPDANKPRAAVKDVYAQIISDLQAAITDLPVTYGTTYETRTRATKAAAAGLLSRVYLYQNDYPNARTTSLNIINGNYGTYALQAEPNGAFGPGKYQTSETVWSIPNNVNDNPNTNNALPQHYFPNGRGDLAISATFLNASTNPYFTADDKRRTAMLIEGTGANEGYIFTNKYPDVGTRSDWAPVIRYAEILLTYAEAAARVASGVDADAIIALNLVRDRAQVTAPSYTAADFADKQMLITAILGERRIELAFEGHRFWDIMRTKGNVANKYDNDGITILPVQNFGAEKSIMPIPQLEVDKSRGVLLQNNGY
ncbi:MAG TPA: RagB/SusD family nutrient uptake outer membrane protein [Chitinophagaceae bacterium]|nr:RagB/SusD family nutrient uptake outer membrane protein [Chitinophagaceae bacterium]